MKAAIVCRIEKQPEFRCVYLDAGDEWTVVRRLARMFPTMTEATATAAALGNAHAVPVLTPLPRPAFCPRTFVAASARDVQVAE